MSSTRNPYHSHSASTRWGPCTKIDGQNTIMIPVRIPQNQAPAEAPVFRATCRTSWRRLGLYSRISSPGHPVGDDDQGDDQAEDGERDDDHPVVSPHHPVSDR